MCYMFAYHSLFLWMLQVESYPPKAPLFNQPILLHCSPYTAHLFWACGACKKKLRSIFITQTDRAGRPSGTHKKCLFTYGDWSAATGVMPFAFFLSSLFFVTMRGKNARRTSIGRGNRWRSERRDTHPSGEGWTRRDARETEWEREKEKKSEGERVHTGHVHTWYTTTIHPLLL